jgi:hypothetical protein
MPTCSPPAARTFAFIASRSMREAEATARRLQASRPASTATIEMLDRAPAPAH